MMLPIISALLAFVAGLFQSRASLCLEHLALRHQPRLRPTDRLFWAWLSRLWPGWLDALAFVQPQTVIAWQRQRFRDHWRRLSQQGKPGRPTIAKEVRNKPRHNSLATGGELTRPCLLDISSTSHQSRTVHSMRPSMYRSQDMQIRGVTPIQHGRPRSPLTETKL